MTHALSAEQRAASVASVAANQRADGLVMWQPGGHADPWNHVEAAMALDVGGSYDAARLAYAWLVDHQRADGSWHQYYDATGVKDEKFDANTIAYVAVGTFHHWRVTGDDAWLAQMWPCVDRALSFVLELQQETGEVFWAREPDGTPFHYALVTGSSSIWHALRCATEIARYVGADVARIDDAARRLGRALREHEREFFAEKGRWAMDWYYPVLTGVQCGEAAAARIRNGWDRFTLAADDGTGTGAQVGSAGLVESVGLGVRCVDDHPWITTGETAEAAIACWRAGMHDEARRLLQGCAVLRDVDGAYFTGLHVPSGAWFPENERTTYSTAAVLLADALLRGDPATIATFSV